MKYKLGKDGSRRQGVIEERENIPGKERNECEKGKERRISSRLMP